jgi:hypothetical protein
MGSTVRLVAILTLWVGTTSCSWFGVIQVRDDIFIKKPLWEVNKFEAKDMQIDKKEEHEAYAKLANKVCTSVHKAGIDKRDKRTQFEWLAHEVLAEDIFMLAKRENIKIEEFFDQEKDKELFPKTLVALTVTQKLFDAVIAEYERLGIVVRCDNGRRIEPRTISNAWIWPSDFKDLEIALSKENRTAIEGDPNGSKYSHLRGNKTSFDFKDLLKAYLMAYYTGSYRDRFGHALAKPELNFPVKNEAVVALASMLYDALWDYSLYLVNKDTLRVGDPIVYSLENGERKYINPEGMEPTFATFLVAAKKYTEEENPPVLKGVLEKVIDETANKKAAGGLTRKDVCIIHYLSGLSGETSQGLAGLIVRSVGGANLGFVVGYGKFSVGDNQMLVKLIDASVETFSKRSADLLFSDILYNVSYEKTGTGFVAGQPDKYPKIDLDWLKEHLELAALLKCFEK